jgi:hydrophobic/amphiphilic exporter-1 (mainly G- bacteria), HAE1 family
MLLSNVSIKRPVFAGMMNLLIIIIGILAFQKIGVDNQPKVDLPIVNIRVQIPGATPKYIEQNVLNPIESALRAIEGIDTIDSTATNGSVNIRVAFVLSQNINVAVNNIRNSITSVTGKRSWPTNALPPVVKPVDPNASSILQIALSSNSEDFGIGDLSEYINNIFLPSLSQVQGVGDVGVAGLRLPEYDISFDNQKLDSLGLTAFNVINQIKSQIVTVPGGQVKNNKLAFNINSTTLPNSVLEVANMPISTLSGQIVRLNEMASIKDTIQEETTYGESNGKPAIIAFISKSSEANTLEVAKNATKIVNHLASSVKNKIDIRTVNDTSRFISGSMEAVNFDIILGAILTITIVFLFLHDWRSTFISSIAIPTSVIGTIGFIHTLGFTLNSMTTLALSLSIGIIVDDAIVVIENIHRHIALGKSARDATYEAMKEIGIPAIAITFAIIAVFLPVAFMDGKIGRYFYEFAITVSASVLISLFVAFTLTPMLGSRILNSQNSHARKNFILLKLESVFHSWEDFYVKCIKFTLIHRYKTILCGFLILFLSLILLHFVPTIFTPKIDTSYFSVSIQLNPNTSIPETTRRSQEIATWLRNYPGIKNVFFRLSNQNNSVFIVNLVDPKERNFSQKMLEQRVRSGLKQFIENNDEIISLGRPGKAQQPIQIILTNPNTKDLEKFAKGLEEYLKKVKGVEDVTSDTPPPAKEIKVIPNYIMANTLGVSSEAIATTLSYLFYGETVGSFNRNGETYDIIAKIKGGQALTPNDVITVTIPGKNNSPIPLSSIANISLDTQNSVVQHHNGIQEYTVLADYTGDNLGQVLTLIEKYMKENSTVGLSYSFSGDSKDLKDSNSAVIQTLLLSLLFAYMVLCSQFESFITPFVILLSVPLAFSGAFIFLLIFNQPMSLYAMVGLILLTGLVKKNAILLLDFTEQQMREGHHVLFSLEIAGRARLRPILMTTFAMIFGMLPMAFGNALGHEQRSPMGVAVIGGLISSTILTLLVIPCVFSVFEDLKHSIKLKMKKTKKI